MKTGNSALWLVIAAGLSTAWGVGRAGAQQFNYLDAGYQQQIYTGALQSGEGGFAWTNSGALLTRWGSNIVEYNTGTTPNLHQGTTAHGVNTVHPVAGLGGIGSGVGLTNGLNGYVYANTTSGLQRIDTSAWTATTVAAVPSSGYGITTLPDGRIAYTDSNGGGSKVYVYNPSTNTNTHIYTSPAGVLIDGMAAGPTGDIVLAGQGDSSLRVISNTGTPLATIAGLGHFPDGLAFSSMVAGHIYANNNDGSITRFDLGPTYTSTPTILDIATSLPGGKAYGDLAAVGPDCAFYVSCYENGGYHGCDPGVGTHWANGVTNAEASYTRINAVIRNPDGTTSPICDFYSPYQTPSPGSLAVLLAGGGMALRRRRPGV